MQEKIDHQKESSQGQELEGGALESSGLFSRSPVDFSLTASTSPGPIQRDEGDPHYLREYTTAATNEEIMGTEEFKSLMNPELVWQRDYDLTYEQSINACRRILTRLDAGEQVNWEAEARRYVQEGMGDPTREESLQQPVGDAAFTAIIAEFRTAAAAATTVADLNTLAASAGDSLWARGRSIAQPGVADADTDLYWARTQLRSIIRENDLFDSPGNLRRLNDVYDSLEQHSRGMHDIRWETEDEGLKRILVTGFDPFGVGTSNPSGILAQRLDGTTISYGDGQVAIVEGVTFPVRYNDFDEGMVEQFAGPLLNDPDQNIFMVMTISLYGPSPYVHLDRYASRHREGHADNSGITSNSGGPEVLPQLGQDGDPAFIETRFPLREMLADPNMPANVAVRQEGSYTQGGVDRQFDGGDATVSPADYRAAQAETPARDPLPPIPSGDITATEGPGGDYLSNEIFYRMSQLTRAVDGRNIPNVHLHIPRVGGYDEANDTTFSIDSILASAQQTLGVAVHNFDPTE